MARANLSNLLSVASATEGTSPQASEPTPADIPPTPETPQTAATTSRHRATRPSARPTRQKAARSAPATAEPAMHWTEYERLEARLRDDQVEQLDVLTRRLNKRRNGEGERITKNTLMRVAVDLLLEQHGDLNGTTEVAIAASLRPTN